MRYSHIRAGLALSLALAGGLAACASAPDGNAPPAPPSTATITRWIAQIEAQGLRRPGYPADAWTERWLRDQFLALVQETYNRIKD